MSNRRRSGSGYDSKPFRVSIQQNFQAGHRSLARLFVLREKGRAGKLLRNTSKVPIDLLFENNSEQGIRPGSAASGGMCGIPQSGGEAVLF